MGSSWTRNGTHVSCIDRQILYRWATKEAQQYTIISFEDNINFDLHACLPLYLLAHSFFIPECPFPSWIIVLVLSDCCNKIQETGWLTNNRNVFIIVLEAGKSNIKAQADLGSDEDLLPRWPSFCYSLTCQKGHGNFSGFFYNGISHACRLCLHDLIIFWYPTSNTTTVGVRIAIGEILEGHI